LRWFNIEFSGKTDHAGTTPLALRKDRCATPSPFINALTRTPPIPRTYALYRCRSGDAQLADSVPPRAFSIDIRHPDPRPSRGLGDAGDPASAKAASSAT